MKSKFEFDVWHYFSPLDLNVFNKANKSFILRSSPPTHPLRFVVFLKTTSKAYLPFLVFTYITPVRVSWKKKS